MCLAQASGEVRTLIHSINTAQFCTLEVTHSCGSFRMIATYTEAFLDWHGCLHGQVPVSAISQRLSFISSAVCFLSVNIPYIVGIFNVPA